MAATALIIGIDTYKNPAWDLAGALRDAVDFAAWAVARGGVAVEDVTMLVSPCDPAALAALLAEREAPAALVERCEEARTDTIRRRLYDLQSGSARTFDRLWFYYAGHGMAPPNTSPEAGPLIVPCDQDDLGYYATHPIGLELFREAMQDVGPREQIYFVDACRDVVELPSSKSMAQHLIWDGKRLDTGALATQAVLLAASAGERAKEIRGKGIFGRVLLAGLRGLGPELVEPTSPTPQPRMRLFFPQLAEFVKPTVRTELEAEGARAEDIQVPEPRTLRGDFELASFDARELPTVKLSPVVMPEPARQNGKIEFLYWDRDKNDFAAHTKPAPQGPPIADPAEFVVSGGHKNIRVSSLGYHAEEVSLVAYEDKRFPVELRVNEQGGLESTGDDRPGGILARCDDRLARVTIFDRNGAVLDSQYQQARAEQLRPGRYRIRAELTASEGAEILVDALPGRTVEHVVKLAATIPAPAPAVLEALERVGISHDKQRGLDASENFGFIASTRLSSLLAYAAWAAQWPPEAGFRRLRELGLPPIADLQVAGSALRVLVGDALGEPGYLERVQIAFNPFFDEFPPIEPAHLQAPGRLPMVRAAASRLPVGSYFVRVQLPGFSAQTFAVSLLTGFVTALIVTREQDGRIDVQQHCNPIDPTQPARPGLPPPLRDDVRLVELAWRALEGRDPLTPLEHQGLIDGKRANPLLAAIAGYRLLGTDREEQFRGARGLVGTEGLGPSALRNMVKCFPQLPDVHVLAALYEPEHQDQSFELASRAGIPVLTEGFRSMVDWFTTSSQPSAPPPLVRCGVASGPWTSFAEPKSTPTIAMVQPSGRAALVDPSILALGPNLTDAVGMIVAPNRGVGSAFLVAPTLMITKAQIAESFAHEQDDGTWKLHATARVYFYFQPDSEWWQIFPRSRWWPIESWDVVRVVATLEPPRGGLKGVLSEREWSECRPVLIELDRPVAVEPLAIAKRAPGAGQAIVAVGFPSVTNERVPEAFGDVFADSRGRRHYMLGTLDPSKNVDALLEYLCFTAQGTSGGPVLDAATGAVLGMHVAGTITEKRRRGLAMPLGGLADALAGYGVRIAP